MKQDYEQQIDELYGEVGRLTTQLSWLKKIWPLIFLVKNESISWNGTASNFLSWFKRIYYAQTAPACITSRFLHPRRRFASNTGLMSFTRNTPVVVRKDATPSAPGQVGFIGGSMGDISVIVRGKDSDENRDSFYSTVYGAGRVMSRTQAAGKMN